MTTTVKILCDSIGRGKRVTTAVCKYSRGIHPEVLTHRTASRSSASSRAVPFEKQLSITFNDPFVPTCWQTENGGMQGGEELPYELSLLANEIWLQGMENSANTARRLHNIGDDYNLVQKALGHKSNPAFDGIRIHKTMPNRLMEPWAHIEVIITATEWEGFFRQRCHQDAEIHMQELAYAIRGAMEESTPTELQHGEWHLPYISGAPDEKDLPNDPILLAMISTARCARVSYLTHDGECNWEKDLKLCEKLRHGSGFGHRAPYEHVAQHLIGVESSGNFRGPWVQYREMAFS